ncbi:hypothetical protein L2E82_50530 [Cichorium intybus]|nr:hypothetical protein L2E82_50530 [Cichorium intybus]
MVFFNSDGIRCHNALRSHLYNISNEFIICSSSLELKHQQAHFGSLYRRRLDAIVGSLFEFHLYISIS